MWKGWKQDENGINIVEVEAGWWVKLRERRKMKKEETCESEDEINIMR